MKTIEKGNVLYTQRESVPVEERVFFRGATGINADDEHFRPATVAEIEEHERYLESIKIDGYGE
jgi:di/tripeptidase